MRLRRHIDINGKAVYGNDEIGRATATDSYPPKVYCRESDVANKDPPWAFIQPPLSDMLDLQSSRETVLFHVLTTQSHNMIRDILERSSLWKGEYVPEAPPEMDEDDGEEFTKPAATSDRTETGPKFKKEREATAAPNNIGKTQGARQPTAPAVRHMKHANGRPSSSPGFLDQRDKSSTQMSPPKQFTPHASNRHGPGESRDSALIKSIIAVAENYDIDDATLVGASAGGNDCQVDAIDLLQSSFSLTKSESTVEETQCLGELFVSSKNPCTFMMKITNTSHRSSNSSRRISKPPRPAGRVLVAHASATFPSSRRVRKPAPRQLLPFPIPRLCNN